MVVEGPIVEATLAERLTNEKKVLEGLLAEDTVNIKSDADLLLVNLSSCRWASYSDESLFFHFSNSDTVKFNNIDFNALYSSWPKQYPSKEQK